MSYNNKHNSKKKKEPQIKYDLILRVASVKILHCEMSGLMNNMTW